MSDPTTAQEFARELVSELARFGPRSGAVGETAAATQHPPLGTWTSLSSAERAEVRAAALAELERRLTSVGLHAFVLDAAQTDAWCQGWEKGWSFRCEPGWASHASRSDNVRLDSTYGTAEDAAQKARRAVTGRAYRAERDRRERALADAVAEFLTPSPLFEIGDARGVRPDRDVLDAAIAKIRDILGAPFADRPEAEIRSELTELVDLVYQRLIDIDVSGVGVGHGADGRSDGSHDGEADS